VADVTYWSFDPDGDPAYKKTFTDKLIQIKSHETHTETQYSHRYDGISCSTTLADEGKCWRFKMIDYTKHPLRWKKVIIPCTDEQEDLMWRYDLEKAGYVSDFMEGMGIGRGRTLLSISRCVSYGPNAIKYDRFGVIFCNISHRRILGSSDKLAWCTESRIMTLLQAHPDLTDMHPDEFRPDNGHELVENYVAGLTDDQK
jgi:hypothetical protein